ncbi:MAG: MBL fold metallo-hydrolase [Thermoplasmata archaeon]
MVDNSVAYGSGYWGEHGFSVLIKSSDGLTLFDVGASEEVLMHNLKESGEDLSDLRRIVISHGHYDHTGGLESILERYSKEATKHNTKQVTKSDTKPELYIHSFAFDKKYSKKEKGYVERGMKVSREFVNEKSILKEVKEGIKIAEGMNLITGIEQKCSFENIDGNFYIKKGEDYIKDEFKDEISLVLESEGKRYVIVGCAHRGIVNILLNAQEKFGKVSGFVGGTHLANAKSNRLQNTIEALSKLRLERAYLSHCSGLRAVNILSSNLEGCYVSQTSGGMVINL